MNEDIFLIFEKQNNPLLLMKENYELALAFDFVQYTNQNIFLTGKAGTGKTTFLRSLKTRLNKRMVVVAPTGVAAINAGGVTVHSFFQLPFGPILTEKVAGHKIDNPNFKKKFAKKKINIIRTLDLLIIDEISMVRADMLDAIDEVLRRYKNRLLPFGGVQLLMIGDLQQLAPVVKDVEWQMMRQYYHSMYFFNSLAIRESGMITIELKHIFRQKDDAFVKILNEVRDDRLSTESYDKLHERYIPDFKPDKKDGYITLTTHNNSADIINQDHLGDIKGRTRKFKAEIEGAFYENAYPTDFNLELKVGAQVMYVKNDSSPLKRYFNGKIGKIISFEDVGILIKCDDGSEITTTTETWENIKYSIDSVTKEISEEVIGSFTQYPLRLAWAITIHKSQGLTFEKAIIDAAAAFSHGQTYVAFSRCKSMEGMVLSSKISQSAIICDNEVMVFNKKVEKNQPDEIDLNKAKYAYQNQLINDIFNYKQLINAVGRLDRITGEHMRSYSGNINDVIKEIQRKTLPEISIIADKFMQQVNYLVSQNSDVENNKELQDRIMKASQYFYSFNDENIDKKIKSISFESDNKSTKKAINEGLTIVSNIMYVMQKALNLCIKGFDTATYLDVRAKSLLEDSKVKDNKNQSIITRDVETKHSDLYALLKFWRREEAFDKGVELFQIASNKALQGIANNLPCTKKQMMAVSGIGKKKISQYGADWLEMVEEYIEEKGLEKTVDSADVIKEFERKNKPKKSKNTDGTTWEQTYKLYKSGKSIEEIAEERGFVLTTIEGHLSRYVATGELGVEKFIDASILKIIITHLEANPDSTLSEIRIAFDNKYSFAELKFARSHFEYLNSKK